jgi:hypothetical protein
VASAGADGGDMEGRAEDCDTGAAPCSTISWIEQQAPGHPASA